MGRKFARYLLKGSTGPQSRHRLLGALLSGYDDMGHFDPALPVLLGKDAPHFLLSNVNLIIDGALLNLSYQPPPQSRRHLADKRWTPV